MVRHFLKKQTNKNTLKILNLPEIFRLCVVAHACNPSYLGDRHREEHSLTPAQAREVGEPPSQPVAGHSGTHRSSQLCNCRGPGWPRHEVRPCLKNNQCKSSWQNTSEWQSACLASESRKGKGEGRGFV
jgi:hypothetical protein